MLLLAACQTGGKAPVSAAQNKPAAVAKQEPWKPFESSPKGLNRQVPDYYGVAGYDCLQDGLAPSTEAYDDCVRIRALDRLGSRP